MVARRRIDEVRTQLHELRGMIWREPALTRDRLDRLDRRTRSLLRQPCTPMDVDDLQSVLRMCDRLRCGVDRPA